ncbi:DUF4232 domain-containing protein [Cellulomonas hominis]|uniref:DUF4232 domain-containing protein n=1 Tax=Cellulomonas hominis TaxID=156981 RepID=UPI001C10608E|nr:DUF4232 domain-containing protein [Cellulomonas hominis]MBU5423227.1 DUF4232 domain-containing protein [Cellulomonas hominis]
MSHLLGPGRAAGAVAAALTAVALLLAGCTDPGPGAAAPPTLVEEVAAIPGVSEATPTADGGLDVRTDVATAREFRDVGRAVAASLPDRPRAGVRVWQPERTGLPALAAELDHRDDAALVLRTVADLAALPGVTDVQATPDSASGTVATVDDLPGLAAATTGLPFTSVLLGTVDQRITTMVGPGVLDDALARVLVGVAGRPGVTSLLLDTRAATDGTPEAWLRVQVQGDDTVAGLARELGATPWPAERPPVHVVVASSFREQGGMLGVPEPDAPAADPATAQPGAPGCAALEVAVAGFDAALGSRYLLLRATNATPDPCVVEGRPEVGFLRASGTLVPDVETGTPTGTPAPEALVVGPGGTVSAQLRWGAMSTSQDPDVTVALLVTPVPGAAAVRLDAPEGGIDVLAGAAVEVGAWQRAVEGWGG